MFRSQAILNYCQEQHALFYGGGVPEPHGKHWLRELELVLVDAVDGSHQ